MGLTLIHGNTQPSLKPRVIVVAEQSVFDALSTDLELDLYPECFNYDSFVKASLSKSISTNNAIVVLSDSLSQKVAPLEAVIALVRSNVVLIPWKSTEAEISSLNVASCSPRPTANTLRRAIFQHCGMAELPPRFDGDNYLEEPPDARVMNFSPQSETNNIENIASNMNNQTVGWGVEPEVDTSKSTSPLDWFSEPQVQYQEPAQQEVVQEETQYEAEQVNAYLPPVEQQKIEEEQRLAEQKLYEEQSQNVDRSAAVQEDEPSFLPEFFGGSQQEQQPDVQQVEAKIEQVKPQHSNIDSIWHDQLEVKSENNQATTQEWLSQTFSNTWSTPETKTESTSTAHPYAESDSLELENYINTNSDISAYQIEAEPQIDESPSTFVPEVAFTPTDDNGNQQMWTMFDTKLEPTNAQSINSLSEFPDGSDHRKAINLFEPLVVCVYSPKGGVGKTSISVNLAARLAYTTRLQVCIVDLDIAFGNVGTRLGLYNPTVRELLNESHIDGESLARNLVYDRRSGLFALLAPLRPETGTNRRKFSPAAYKKILSLLKERFDVVLLDCPVELRDPLVSGFALPEAGEVVMVVNNEQATLLDARRAVEAMCRPKDSQRLPGLGIDPNNVGMVVNQKVDNVGREVEDIRAILGGGDPNHPSRQIEILSVISDDRQLWVGNANMGRTVATSGENTVDKLLDDIWAKVLPSEAANDFESQEFNPTSSNPLDDILSRPSQNDSKKKKKFNPFKK
ncbi:MAG: AAA family ATPase [Acidimicrobiia bacterium]